MFSNKTIYTVSNSDNFFTYWGLNSKSRQDSNKYKLRINLDTENQDVTSILPKIVRFIHEFENKNHNQVCVEFKIIKIDILNEYLQAFEQDAKLMNELKALFTSSQDDMAKNYNTLKIKYLNFYENYPELYDQLEIFFQNFQQNKSLLNQLNIRFFDDELKNIDTKQKKTKRFIGKDQVTLYINKDVHQDHLKEFVNELQNFLASEKIQPSTADSSDIAVSEHIACRYDQFVLILSDEKIDKSELDDQMQLLNQAGLILTEKLKDNNYLFYFPATINNVAMQKIQDNYPYIYTQIVEGIEQAQKNSIELVENLKDKNDKEFKK